MAVLAIAVIGLATAISGSQFSFGTGLLNWVVLVAVASFALWTLSETVEYSMVLGDFRVGAVAIIAVVVVAHVVDQTKASVGLDAYLGVIAYGLIGLTAIALARRFAIEDPGSDQRQYAFEREWVLSIGILMGGLAIVSLVLAQIFAYDIVGAAGHILTPAYESVGAVFAFVGEGIIALVTWLAHFLGLHPIKPHRLRIPRAPRQQSQPVPPYHHRVTQVPAFIVDTLKVIGLILVGLTGLALITAMVGASSGILDVPRSSVASKEAVAGRGIRWGDGFSDAARTN